MSSEAEPSASDDEPDRSSAATSSRRGRSRRRLLAYTLFTVMLGIWVLAPLLSFSDPDFAHELVWVYFACLITLFFLFLGVAYRLWWKELAIFLAIWAVVLMPWYVSHLGIEMPLAWLRVIGFRIHASPVEEYLSRCKLIRFVENGVNQELGRCETFGGGGESVVDVFYDTTGEIMLPASQRTPEWKKAMWHFSPHEVLIESEGRARHLFGSYYDIVINLLEFDGDDERY